jgi:fructose-1,6-bisphosphatase I
MSFIMEKAGGVAMANGKQRLLELKPAQLHQRMPIFIGSRNMMDTWQRIMND